MGYRDRASMRIPERGLTGHCSLNAFDGCSKYSLGQQSLAEGATLVLAKLWEAPEDCPVFLRELDNLPVDLRLHQWTVLWVCERYGLYGVGCCSEGMAPMWATADA